MSDNNSGIKASKRRQMEARRRRLRRRKRKRAMLLGGMLCTVCLILFGTIYGISHLLHKHTDTKEAVKTSPKQTAKSKDTSSSKEKIDTSAVKTQELVINTDTNSGKKKKGSSSKGPTTITISSMGDCTLGTDESFDQSTSFNAYYNEYGADYFFKNVRSILEADDLSVVNFEGTLTEETSRADKTFAFKGPAKYTDILTGSSVEAANIANNHSKDYGTKSQEDTIENQGHRLLSLISTGELKKNTHQMLPRKNLHIWPSMKEPTLSLVITHMYWKALKSIMENILPTVWETSVLVEIKILLIRIR